MSVAKGRFYFEPVTSKGERCVIRFPYHYAKISYLQHFPKYEIEKKTRNSYSCLWNSYIPSCWNSPFTIYKTSISSVETSGAEPKFWRDSNFMFFTFYNGTIFTRDSSTSELFYPTLFYFCYAFKVNIPSRALVPIYIWWVNCKKNWYFLKKSISFKYRK